MGIKGLHQAIKHLKVPVHLHDVGKTIRRVAVDASAYMVKGSVKYARDIHYGTLQTTPWTDYCMDLACLLMEHGIEPIFVFDGNRLCLKDETSAARQRSRDEAQRDALELEAAGDVEKAYSKWMQAFRLEDSMEDDAIDTLSLNGIMCIRSKFESDQTMATLFVQGRVDAVVTEDSDIIAYGVKVCLFKLNLTGYCELLNIPSCTPDDEGHQQPSKKQRRVDVSLASLSRHQIARMCALSGNDYNENVRGVGIKKVYTMILQHSWDACLSLLNVSSEYIDRISKTLHVFLHPEQYTTQDVHLKHDYSRSMSQLTI